MISIEGLSPAQQLIADSLWTATDADSITALMLVHGRASVQLVQELMILAVLDTVDADLTDVRNYLQQL